MYTVRNLTDRVVTLSDIRVEIGPKRIVDLEQIVDRDKIDRSHTLRQALEQQILSVVKQTVVKTHIQTGPKPEIRVIERTIERTIEKHNETKMSDIEDKIQKTIEDTIKKSLSNLQIHQSNEQQVIETIIDPAKLAELQQLSVSKISENIETNVNKQNKKISIINTKNIKDLASEL